MRRPIRVATLLLIGLMTACPSADLSEAARLRGARAGLQAVRDADPDMRPIAAATAVGLVERGRLPEPFTKAFRHYATERPSTKASEGFARVITASPEVMEAGCPAFERVAAEMVELPDRERPLHLFAACDFARLGLFSDAEAFAEMPEYSHLATNRVLVHFIVAYLRETHGELEPTEFELLRAMAGIGPTAG